MRHLLLRAGMSMMLALTVWPLWAATSAPHTGYYPKEKLLERLTALGVK
jgi:hypothetical protein